MGDSQHDLNVAQVALYIMLSIPTLYILICHGLPGILGWFYLLIFCSLRVVGGALALHNGSIDKTAAIISSIGLSPLLLAVSGVLHEARLYRNPTINKKIEFILVLFYHIMVTTGLALLASGSSAFGTNTSNKDKGDETLLKVGIVILLLCWVVLCVRALFSLLPEQVRRDAATFTAGQKILSTVFLSLPFVGIRVLYSLISILAPSKNLSPVHAAIGLKVALSFIAELVTVTMLVVVGGLTRNVRKESQSERIDATAVRMENGNSWTRSK